MGEVSTPLMAADNIKFGPESIYYVVDDSVKARTNTYRAKIMALAQFARNVFDSTVLEGVRLDKEEARSIIFKLGEAKAKKDAPGKG
ncbi:hypothetical protein N7539_001425 [Penicillium diatomitis]|uniref:Uncharacterized protein n=1 Tax=Penicillium diatomitis TaxID=2819901 RepID=A0A9W9XHX5_9EURO|nr:uncharacterized protein N7539_001425 [Penicillium diatomitis]KAJ5492679.1 hypothetical protein N7539_001425 [Penicillium diatomitis]